MAKYESTSPMSIGMSSMVDHSNYVPALRWKQAEWMALRYLEDDVRRAVTPILEIPASRFQPRKAEARMDVEGRLEETVEEIANSWGRSPFFLDLRLLDASFIETATSNHMLTTIAALCELASVQMVPIARLDSNHAYMEATFDALAVSGKLGLRIHSYELLSPGFESKAHRVRKLLGIPFSDMHLIVDFGFIQGEGGAYAQVRDDLPLCDEWESITFLG